MSYKTLILVDNSDTITSLNREIIKDVIRYLIINGRDETKVAVATMDNGLNYLCDYEDTSETKSRSLEGIDYVETDTFYGDVLMDTLEKWEDEDYSQREIVVISNGHDAKETYTYEELYFQLNNSTYPVYTICLDQNENEAAMKRLSSLSRISGGTTYHTEVNGEESEMEVRIGNGIIEDITEYRLLHETQYDNTDYYEESEEQYDATYEESALSDKILVENNVLFPTETSENESSIIYEMPGSNSDDNGYLLIPVFAIGMLLFVILLAGYFRNRKKEKLEDQLFMKSVRSSISKKDISDGGVNRNYISKTMPEEDETRPLDEEYETDDGGTRLLYQSMDGVDITLEDRADPTKYFRACIHDRMVIGRSKKLCDLAIPYDDSVSSRHCELFLRGTDIYVRDLSSSNGTAVNQQKVYQEIKLNTGDILRLGQLSLMIQILRRGEFAGL